MMSQPRLILLTGLLALVFASLFGCQSEDQSDPITTTQLEGVSLDAGNYAQMEDGSTVVDGHQLNWVFSDISPLPYASWVYVELNEQDAIGAQPGEHQVPVTLSDVVLQFSGLPDEATQILIAGKTRHEGQDSTYTELGRFALVNGSATIPLSYHDLVAYFGVTHYSIWFQVLGGQNGQGAECGYVALNGVMPSGQRVTFSTQLCLGTNTVSPPPPTCEGTLIDGFCWYLSETNTTCAATCQAEGLIVDTTVDASGYFWDTHDEAYCRNVLVLLEHPYIALSTSNLSIAGAYGLCGASQNGSVIKFGGGPQDATHPFANGQVACPCR